MTRLPKPYGYDNGYISLGDLYFKGLPERVNVNGENLQLKNELHISLICAKRIAALIDSEHTEEVQREIVEVFSLFVKTTHLNTFQPSKKFRLVKRDERKTVVMMVEVPHLEEFFDRLSDKYDRPLPLQPTHVTLYTLQPEAGIGILSQEELERDSEPVEVAELRDMQFLVKSINSEI